MEDLEIKRLNIFNIKFFSYYKQAFNWDKEKTWFNGPKFMPDISLFFLQSYGLFLNNEYVGYATICKKNKKLATIGIIINYNYRHKGLGKYFLNELLKEAFNKQNYKMMRAKILFDNISSIRLFEGFGFKLNGKDNYYLLKKEDYKGL